MTQEEYLDGMRSASSRLSALFEHPEPGLATWHGAVGDVMRNVMRLWFGDDVNPSLTIKEYMDR